MFTAKISRRATLGLLAATPVAAKVAHDDLTSVEIDLLTLSARDFSTTTFGGCDSEGRQLWNIDPAKYPLLGEGDEALDILRSLERRGFVERHDSYCVLRNGNLVDAYYVATDKGRAALAAHATT